MFKVTHNKMNSFFTSGETKDPDYKCVRDQANQTEVREFIESLWQKYAEYADPHFLNETKIQFHPRFWEMYLTCTLLERGFKIQRFDHEGPEYFFMVENRRIWVEAIAPIAGVGDDKVPDIPIEGISYSPAEKILMRFTHALNEKYKKYKIDLSKGIIKPEDYIILAINSRAIPGASFSIDLPYYVKALLPIGNLHISVDLKTLDSSEPSYQYRDKIFKTNGSSVATTSFLNPDFSPFIAVIHSSVNCVNRPEILGDDFSVFHNPLSKYKLMLDQFFWCQQFTSNDNSLLETHPLITYKSER